MDYIKMLNGSESSKEIIDTSDAGEFMSRIYESCGRAVSKRAVGRPGKVAPQPETTAK